MDFDIKEIKYETDSYDSSCLVLNISGKDAHHSIINSLRKVCLDQIPIYALDRGKIKIFRNSSVYDCTEMEVRLSQLPIKRVPNNVIYLPLKYYKNVNFADTKLEKHPDDNTNVEFYLNAKNTGPNKIKYVTTDDLRISINNDIVENKNIYRGKEPITLIELRVGEEFECSMKGVIAVGELNSIFNSSNTFYKQIKENEEYLLTIESNGQLDEYELLIRGINIIIEKLKIIKENIVNLQYEMIVTENNSINLIIKNEDYTCGGPLNYILQGMKEVEFSGVYSPNLMEKNIAITCVIDKKYKIIDIFSKAIDNTIELYNSIEKKVKKISKK
jgi:DNA-directed RNA polymerase subunit L